MVPAPSVARPARRSSRQAARIVPVALVVVGLVLLAFVALRLRAQAQVPRVHGLLTSVQARDIGHAASFTMRTDDGRDLRFRVEDSVDMTPGHMREHATFGQPVTVYYRHDGADLVATNVTD